MRLAALVLLCTLASGCATLDGLAPAPEVRRLAEPGAASLPASFGVVRSSDGQVVHDRHGNPVLHDLS